MPADHEGSISVFFVDFVESELIFSKYVINSDKAFGFLLKIRFSTSLFSSSLMSVYGVISFTLTMALSNPALTAWYRKTEFNALLACGDKPKLMLLKPSVVTAFGKCSFTSLIPSNVFFQHFGILLRQ